MLNRIQILVGMLFAASFIITGCESTWEATLEEHNKELVRRDNEEIRDKNKLEIMDELYSNDIVRHFLSYGSETKSIEL